VEDALDSVIMTALNKGIEVVCVIDPRMPPKVRGDGDRLKQVVLNLLSVGPGRNCSKSPSTRLHPRLLTSMRPCDVLSIFCRALTGERH
jgi:hypothetical protein